VKTFHATSYKSEKEFEKDVRKYLVHERKRLKLSQTDVAKKLGKDFTWVSHFERGKIRLRMDTFVAYVNALGLEVQIDYAS